VTLGSLRFYHRREVSASISVFDSLCRTRTRADSSVYIAVRPTPSYATSYRIAPSTKIKARLPQRISMTLLLHRFNSLLC
jgi:hypothetical protein